MWVWGGWVIRIKNKKYFNEVVKKKKEVLMLGDLKSDVLNAIKFVF